MSRIKNIGNYISKTLTTLSVLLGVIGLVLPVLILTRDQELLILIGGILVLTIVQMVNNIYMMYGVSEINKEQLSSYQEHLLDLGSKKASIEIEKDLLEQENSNLLREIGLLRNRIVNTQDKCHEISHVLRDYNHKLIQHYSQKNGDNAEQNAEERPLLSEYMINALNEIKDIFDERTDSKNCSVAVKTVRKIVLPPEAADITAANMYAVNFYRRDSTSNKRYRKTDKLFSVREKGKQSLLVANCYEYAYLFSPSPRKHHCYIHDVQLLKDLPEGGRYFHYFSDTLKESIAFTSKLVVPICYRGNSREIEREGMEKIYGFLEVECDNNKLNEEDHQLLHSFADRLYSTFLLDEMLTRMGKGALGDFSI